MPRKPRELVDGAIYHVFNRGNDRRNLFSEPEDYHCFLNYLRNSASTLSIELYHYCLMPNHFHLLLKIQKTGDLAKLMHQIQLAYARYFKKTRAFVVESVPGSKGTGNGMTDGTKTEGRD